MTPGFQWGRSRQVVFSSRPPSGHSFWVAGSGAVLSQSCVEAISTAQVSRHGIRGGLDALLERSYQPPTTSIATQHMPRPLLPPDEILALPKPQRGPGGAIAQPGA
jgi:hypothetical protein